ncbi:sulfatase [Paenibacillus sp. J5C_2022]|uniref:sulfatase family protein n=1 Tax=Paenibacillus sp. J5C2022 TaxID=2977129 RepID=UPI0021D25BA3|nr:sulfatase [Paenibacillus sp. J5C2022]MCU6710583.1 sulfatase [Paenibacillus sp. J5C2022]
MSNQRPNIVFIMSDDHASQAMSCYGSRINKTPNIDRIASEGMRFDHTYCTNAICTPSRATILTGLYNHANGVRTLDDELPNTMTTFPKLMREDGYQTAMIGKWHLGHSESSNPAGFDFWSVVPGQGEYIDPQFIEADGVKTYPGYVTDVITDMSIDWLEQRDRDKPFLLLCHHKAPHRPWVPNPKDQHLYDDIDIPEPETFYDDYATRSRAAREAKMRVDRDLTFTDLKAHPPEGLSELELKRWNYQRYMKDYLRCIHSIDENVGRLLDYLDEQEVADNTIVVYTSDQGFFLGEHGWYDKRFMYEESLRMPFVVRYPNGIKPGTVCDAMALNVDFAQTFLAYAGIDSPKEMQGVSLKPLLEGGRPEGWRTSMYYRYWMHLSEHNVCAHYGIRTEKHKLIYYYGEALGTTGSTNESWEPEWELFDLEKDPYELNNVYCDPAYADTVLALKLELARLQHETGDNP